ncbi:Septin-9 [Varanus komodoensis]|nr:Septin-9 [Varanus komodoensis]
MKCSRSLGKDQITEFAKAKSSQDGLCKFFRVRGGFDYLHIKWTSEGHDLGIALIALKRSFEVEEVDQPSNSSTPQRRTPNPLGRSAVSSSTQKFQELGTRNSESPSRHVESSAQRSPKSSLRRVELSGPKHPETVSRRTEISIDISSKQVENSSSGASRFGLKRADVLGHKPPETAPRRTEINIGKPQDQALRRMEVPSKIPEPTQRRVEATSPPMPDVATKRVEIQVTKSSEVPVPPVRQTENVELFSANQHPPTETKLQLAVTEIPPKSQEGKKRT